MFDSNPVPILSMAAPCGDAALGVDGDVRLAPSIGFETAQATVRRINRPADPLRVGLVGLVRHHVVAHFWRPVSGTEMAVLAGVSAAVLRAAETGKHWQQFVRDLCLDAVRMLLSTDHETRSVARLAKAFGYRPSSTLGRSYRRRFGETVSGTRSRTLYSKTLADKLAGHRQGFHSCCTTTSYKQKGSFNSPA